MQIRKTFRVLVVGALALGVLPAMSGCPRKKTVFSLTPPNMLFSADEFAGVPPPDQILTMTGIKEIPEAGLPWTAVSDQPWLTVNPSSGIIHAREVLSLTVSADQTGLGVSIYDGTLTIEAVNHRNRYPQTYDVSLDVFNTGPTQEKMADDSIVAALEAHERHEVELQRRRGASAWTGFHRVKKAGGQ